MQQFKYKSSTSFLLAGTFAALMLGACSKPEDANDVASQQLVEATQKAQDAAARAETAQKALEDAQAAQAAAATKASADQEQAEADAKLKTAQDRAAAAEREAAAAKKRASTAERQVASSSSTYTEARPVAPPPPVCQDCGTITSITPIAVQGKGSGAGAVGGAIAGAVIGHQIGRGQGNKIAEAVGAIAGGFGGNAAEKRIRATTEFDVAVRMDNGSTRTVRIDDDATIANGSRVRVVGNNLEHI